MLIKIIALARCHPLATSFLEISDDFNDSDTFDIFDGFDHFDSSEPPRTDDQLIGNRHKED